jgi:Domain of unknown function (DUF4326)
MTDYVQRSRRKGFKLPPNTRCCTRGTKWGNPFTGMDADLLVNLYTVELRLKLGWGELDLAELARYDHLACWCKPGEVCHVQDVLIPAVNEWKEKHK